MSTDVIVIGGGIVGCATAYYCARDGMRVTLLEKETVGYGASGRNVGFLWLHCRSAGFALDIARAGRNLYPELLQELPGGFEFRPSGGLMYFTTPEQGAVFEEFVAARKTRRPRHDADRRSGGASPRASHPPRRPGRELLQRRRADRDVHRGRSLHPWREGGGCHDPRRRHGRAARRLRRPGRGRRDRRGPIQRRRHRRRHWRLEHGPAGRRRRRCPDRRRAPPGRHDRATAVLDRAARVRSERDQAIRAVPRPAVLGPGRVHNPGPGSRRPGPAATPGPAGVRGAQHRMCDRLPGRARCAPDARRAGPDRGRVDGRLPVAAGRADHPRPGPASSPSPPTMRPSSTR